MSTINFRPFVGEYYETGGIFDKKVLVLGESHYCFEPADGKCKGCSVANMKDSCHSQTEDVVEEFIDDYRGESYQQTFLCFERALAGREINKEERYSLWNSLMFYNYFQLVTDNARKAPNPEAVQMSEEAFHSLLEEYMPDVIIVWGSRLYDLLPGWDGKETNIVVDGDSTRVWHYQINGKDIPAMEVHHPSSPSGKSWSFWHKFHEVFVGKPRFK